MESFGDKGHGNAGIVDETILFMTLTSIRKSQPRRTYLRQNIERRIHIHLCTTRAFHQPYTFAFTYLCTYKFYVTSLVIVRVSLVCRHEFTGKISLRFATVPKIANIHCVPCDLKWNARCDWQSFLISRRNASARSELFSDYEAKANTKICALLRLLLDVYVKHVSKIAPAGL